MAIDFASEMSKVIGDIKEAKVAEAKKPKNLVDELDSKLIISDFVEDENYIIPSRQIRRLMTIYTINVSRDIVFYIIELWERYASNIDTLQSQAIKLANQMGKGEIHELNLDFQPYIDKEYVERVHAEWVGRNMDDEEYMSKEIDDETKQIVEKIFQTKLNEYIESKIERKLSGKLNENEELQESFLIMPTRVREDSIKHNDNEYVKLTDSNKNTNEDSLSNMLLYFKVRYNKNDSIPPIPGFRRDFGIGRWHRKEYDGTHDGNSLKRSINNVPFVVFEIYAKPKMLNKILNDTQKELLAYHFNNKVDKYRQAENIPYYEGTIRHHDGRIEKQKPYRTW
ncbi:hypothetical protein DCO58_12090 [Helicobacter saguini]|uniref:Uncharacterized protein n=1 Tax=Helicobacter saguini TaxID=1548018 RepID=A0A099B7H5_9HELI|nr:hypothetical protein [Helicobacter saguini]MWV60970.1 hypothetical protein [Helicobacter saguini]MWV68361.1 hypothetical protein [Helicobacter saguini]MWV70174.1 hypothetical protein [Helicobacter saguini]MWV72077.1 hypothetical protein [Helicobacter saguini]TLD93702.1 hypothetical protein LS64_007870 [Helicobacter saguini]